MSAGAISLTCSHPLASAAAHRDAPLYLHLLPEELIAIVDRLVEVNAWRSASGLTRLPLPQWRWNRMEHLVDRQGHLVLLLSASYEGVRHHSVGVWACADVCLLLCSMH